MTEPGPQVTNTAMHQGRCRTFWSGGHMCMRPPGHPELGPNGGHRCAGPRCPEPLFWPVPAIDAKQWPSPHGPAFPADVWGSDAGEHYRCGVQRDDNPFRALKGR